jgi:AbrB family looped-hinge helix DNA binding protein
MPYGPRQITSNRQVAVPKELMDRAHIQPGDQVYLQWNDQQPGTILIIPVEIMSEWIRIGRQTQELMPPSPSP